MSRLTIIRLRNLVRSLNVDVTRHAEEELDQDGLTLLDLESILLSGHISERHRDRHTGVSKYIIQGITLNGIDAEAVVKLGQNGRLIVITVYVL